MLHTFSREFISIWKASGCLPDHHIWLHHANSRRAKKILRLWFYDQRHCGRAARYRADPAYHPDDLAGQIPASQGIATLMRNYRTGLFRDTRVRKSSYVRPGTKANLTRFGRLTMCGFTTPNWANSCLNPTQLYILR